MQAFLVAPFQGLLAFFLLDMGILVARQMLKKEKSIDVNDKSCKEWIAKIAKIGSYTKKDINKKNRKSA